MFLLNMIRKFSLVTEYDWWNTQRQKCLLICHTFIFSVSMKLLSGNTVKNYVDIQMTILWQGGGWCNNVRTCVYRKKTRRGSSTYMEKEIPFTGIMSTNAEENPGFHFIVLIGPIILFFFLIYLDFCYLGNAVSPCECRFFQLEQSEGSLLWWWLIHWG